jgi:hypothetical protein
MMIATVSFLCERNDARLEIAVEIGKPYQCGEEEWACPIALHGLHDGLPDVRGPDAFQALCLTIRLALSLLTGFKEKGGKILYRNGEEVSLGPYLLTREAE